MASKKTTIISAAALLVAASALVGNKSAPTVESCARSLASAGIDKGISAKRINEVLDETDACLKGSSDLKTANVDLAVHKAGLKGGPKSLFTMSVSDIKTKGALAAMRGQKEILDTNLKKITGQIGGVLGPGQ